MVAGIECGGRGRNNRRNEISHGSFMIYSWITDPGTITISEIKFWGECVRGCGGGYSNRLCGYYMGSGGMNSVQRRHWGVGPLRHPYSWACIVSCILTADDGISLTRPSRDSFCLTPLSSGFLLNKSLSSDFCSGLILCNLSLLLVHVNRGYPPPRFACQTPPISFSSSSLPHQLRHTSP